MIGVLALILFLLCIIVGGVRGFKTFLVLFLDVLFCMINVLFVGLGANPILTTFILSIILSLIILFFVNGYNEKTISSFIATFIVLCNLIGVIYIFVSISNVAGFSEEYIEEIAFCNYNININLVLVSVSTVIIGLIGSIIDTSTAVSTAVYEIYDKNRNISFDELVSSGNNVGVDVIATVTNTLFFAFLGEFLTLLFWFYIYKMNFLDVINNKVFVAQLITIMFNALGSLFIIPITNYVTSYVLVNKEKRFSIVIRNSVKKFHEE